MKFALSVVTLLPFATAAQTIYKCDVDGAIVFQEVRCEDETEQEALKPRRYNSTVAQPTPDMSRAVVDDRLIKQQKVAVGMTRESALRSWGNPDDINRRSGGHEQWVYRRGAGSSQYIYIENGVVTSWSSN